MAETVTTPTAEEIAQFMTYELADKLNVNQAEIDQDTPFVDLGMSSLDAINLVGQLEINSTFKLMRVPLGTTLRSKRCQSTYSYS